MVVNGFIGFKLLRKNKKREIIFEPFNKAIYQIAPSIIQQEIHQYQPCGNFHLIRPSDVMWLL